MNLFLKIVDGKPVNHPSTEENLLQAFPEGIPVEYEPFERSGTHNSEYGVFEKSIVEYVKNGDVWTDSWSIAPMTEEEKAVRIEEISTAVTRQVKQENLRIAEYNIMLATAMSDLRALQAWSKYADVCKAWTLKSVVPTTPPIPAFPERTPEGFWIEPNNWIS